MKNTPITNIDLVSQVINAAARLYKIIIKQVKYAKGSRVTVDDIVKQMEYLYCIYKEDDSVSEDGGKGEVALITIKGKCYK